MRPSPLALVLKSSLEKNSRFMKASFLTYRSAKLANAALFVAILASASLQAQTIWTRGSGTDDWNTAGNWSTGAVPNSSSVVVELGANATTISVPSGGRAVGTLNFAASATNAITVNSATSFRINTAITVDAANGYNNTISNSSGLFLGNSSSNLTGANTVTFTNNSSHLLTLSGGAIQAAAATTGNASVTLALAGEGSFTFNSAITQASSPSFSNTLNLVKGGNGTTIMNSVSTAYKGTTVVNLGTLLVNGVNTGGAAYTVNSGGTLGGGGSIITANNAGVTLASGGKLAPGVANGAAGTLTMNLGSGVLDLSGGLSGDSGALLFNLGASSDKILLSGSSTLNIGASLLDFGDFSFTADAGFAPGVYTLIETSTVNAISGVLGSNLTGTVGSYTATLSVGLNESGYQDIILTVVPEPSTVYMMIFGGILLLFRLRPTRRSL